LERALVLERALLFFEDIIVASFNEFHIPVMFKLHFFLFHLLLQSIDISLILRIQHTI
jgi:hypothetical protein